MSGLRLKLLIIAFLITIILSLSFELRAQENFRAVFYNVENLFDIKNNPDKNDNDFTPEGQLHWTNYRYWKKINNISKVLSSIGGKYPPALIGLCEVENDSVLYHLTNRTTLRKDKYRYIISNSNDIRGANVALLYQRDQIKILTVKEYTPILETEYSKSTRNILHVSGKVVSGDTLDIFICHFPSRNEGIKKSQPYRIICAQLLKQKTDSIFNLRKKAHILIMGDFNDNPNDISIRDALHAQDLKSFISNRKLYNMFYNKYRDKNAGTYKYQGKWNYLDQIIVSGNLLNNYNRIKIKDRKAHIYSPEFLLEDDKKYGGKKPFRTYSGFKYLGGTSDHLPIYIDLLIK